MCICMEMYGRFVRFLDSWLTKKLVGYKKARFFQLLHFSPSKLVTKRTCPLYQCIASHTTTMNKGGGVKGGEYGIFKTKSLSTFR